MTTAYHAKYYAHELTRQAAGGDVDRLSTSLFDASVDLNPHQIEAALFALRSPLSKGVVLADEVGLGKTIEAGLVLCQYWAERKRRLIVICPASLRRQWAAELSEKFNLPTLVLDAQAVRKLRKEGTHRPFEQRAVVMLSYHYANRVEDDLRAVAWDLVVMDEAHKLRNAHQPSNRMGKTLRRTFDGRRKLLLTATPLQNSLMELFGLSSLIDEHLFGDDKAFRKQYMQAGADLPELRARLTGFVKRTLRKQVLEYVRYTARRAITQPFTPSEDEQRLYEAVSAYMLRDDAFALPSSQRHLTTLILRKLLASSSTAVAGTLERMHKRLVALREGQQADENIIDALIDEDDLDDDYREAMEEESEEAEDAGSNNAEALERERLETEIAELAQYIDWAKAIKTDGKTTQLLTALETGFSSMAETGAARKALIFTESRRTQAYLRQFLSANGFAGKLVTFNGSNTDPESTAIYQDWLAANQGADKVTGSKPVDRRTALIDHFRDTAEIMIATEAAAEGVNLQFCSLVVNYDLPWNPQRIEQRIGRCHRYGQKHDVVVVNFVNTRNHADQRVLELLTDKFRLFDGIFGASDEVLGRIESGIDFEKRILDIVQSCRTEAEIQQAFTKLQQDLEADIATRMDETQQLLIEHFDEDIHDLLRIQLDRARERLDHVGRLFWTLTRFVLADHAAFDTEAPRFTLHNPPASSIPGGRYRLVRDVSNTAVVGSEHIYRLTHPLGERVLDAGKTAETPLAELRFDITHHPTRLSIVEALKGERGWLTLDLLAVETLQLEEHLIFTALSDDGRSLDQETCEKLFLCQADRAPTPSTGIEPPIELNANAQRHCEAAISRIVEANNRFFQDEREKLEKWAEDKILAAEQALHDTKAKLRALKRESRQATSTNEQHKLQVRIREVERDQRRQRQAIFDVEDEIIEKRDTLIDALEQRLQQHTAIQRLFSIRWTIV
ncbi:ATP-dependent helicase [Lamprobacter modestohalophilus]|uniref:ATP-dependent helicase n=1 Tax=Lamprobacter modestohalophilus TaxID=1064514 RepID=A0A9X0W7N3_9GAMM|nr:SNF2-related protein [Lamprobacter modestohalophilus]MBK1618474.1 ATP-dependent helicase [Lamprobacter modestohalophilus]